MTAAERSGPIVRHDTTARRAWLFTGAAALVFAGCSFFTDSDGLAGDAAARDASIADGAFDATNDAAPGDASRDGGGGSDASDATPSCPDASFQSDPRHCGACGHDCLGGTCNEGRCAPTALASGQVRTLWLALSANSVFWSVGSAIATCPKSGCGANAPLAIVSGRTGIHEIVAGAGRVFWTECGASDGAAYSCPDTGCAAAAPTLMASGFGCLEALALDEPHSVFYFASWENLYSCPLDTCSSASSSRIAKDRTGYISSLELVGATPFWLEAEIGLHACVAPSCIPEGARLVAQTQRNAISTPSVVGSFAYWTSYWAGPAQDFDPDQLPQITVGTGGVVVRAPLTQNGGAAEVLIAGGSPTAVVADDTGFWFADHLSGSILACPSSGCDAGAAPVALGQGKPFSLVQDESALYWGNYGDGRIMKLAK
jgi:hypothetical protein